MSELSDREVEMRADGVQESLGECRNCGGELTDDDTADDGDFCSMECQDAGEFERAIDQADALMDRMKEGE